MNATQRHGLLLDPLDVLFFRDGRPFGPATRAGGGLPLPQTLWGAITSALLSRAKVDFDALRQAMNRQPDFADALASISAKLRWIGELSLRGPWLAKRNAANASEPPLKIFFPAPATLRQFKRGQQRDCITLLPLKNDRPLPGWPDSGPHETSRPLWADTAGATEPVRGFLDQAAMQSFLNGKPITAGAIMTAETLFKSDERTGIKIDADRLTAAESQIYGARFLSLAEGVAFYAEVDLPNDAPADALPALDVLAWGGEGRRVRVEHVPPQMLEPAADQNRKPLLVLTTPALFDDGWRPACLADKVVSAAVPERLAVSGWDMARRGPKPNRFAAPAGSVYFLDSFPPDWPDALSDRPLDRRQGWGRYLIGTWTDG